MDVKERVVVSEVLIDYFRETVGEDYVKEGSKNGSLRNSSLKIQKGLHQNTLVDFCL